MDSVIYKTLRHYLTTYQKPDSPDSILSSLFFPTTFMMSEEFDDPFQPLSSDPSHRSVTPLTQPIYTESISQDILKDPVKVLYLFQCFQEAQDYVLCKLLSKSFDDGVIDINNHSFLPHQVVSLGFFLSRSQRKWKGLNLHKCYLRDNDMSIIHQYLCGDKANTQEITKIDLSNNDLTGASSHLLADIISHLQPQTLLLNANNITNVRDISIAVITTAVKELAMGCNGLNAEEAVAISDMMICLEELDISNNKLGDHGAVLLSEGIANTKTLRVLDIIHNNIGPSGTTAIANALSNNTSLEELSMCECSFIGRDAAKALGSAIVNNKKLKRLVLYTLPMYPIDEESAMIIIRSLFNNNTNIELCLDITMWENDVTLATREVEMANSIRKSHNLINFQLQYINPQGKPYATYTTQGKLLWES